MHIRQFASGSTIAILILAASYLVGLLASWLLLEVGGSVVAGVSVFNLPDPQVQLVQAIWLVVPAFVSAYLGVRAARRRRLTAAARQALRRSRRLRVAVVTAIVAYLTTWIAGVPRVLSEQRGVRWVRDDKVSLGTYDHMSCCALPLLPFVVVNYHEYRIETPGPGSILVSGVDITLWHGTGVRTLAIVSDGVVYIPGVLKTTDSTYVLDPLGSQERPSARTPSVPPEPEGALSDDAALSGRAEQADP